MGRERLRPKQSHLATSSHLVPAAATLWKPPILRAGAERAVRTAREELCARKELGRLDWIRHPQIRPLLCWEIADGQQFLVVPLETFHRVRVFRLVLVHETAKRLVRRLSSLFS